MPKNKERDIELKDLMNIISVNYTKEEIEWYLSLAPQTKLDSTVEIKISSNSYAD